MATVHITLGRLRGGNGREQIARPEAPVPDSVPIGSDTFSTSGTSTQSASLEAPDTFSFWSVTATGGNVYVAFGDDPVAAADFGWLILDGQTRDFGACEAGEKIAVKSA
jgi:hypothetical protein